MTRRTPPAPRLTPAEARVLRLMATGNARWVITPRIYVWMWMDGTMHKIHSQAFKALNRLKMIETGCSDTGIYEVDLLPAGLWWLATNPEQSA